MKTWRMEDLPMMPERFKLVVIPQTRGQFQAVKSLIERKDVAEIIIATDAVVRENWLRDGFWRRQGTRNR